MIMADILQYIVRNTCASNTAFSDVNTIGTRKGSQALVLGEFGLCWTLHLKEPLTLPSWWTRVPGPNGRHDTYVSPAPNPPQPKYFPRG